MHQPRKASQLDSMLGTLQASMDKQGVSATQKGVCAACHKPIVGQVYNNCCGCEIGGLLLNSDIFIGGNGVGENMAPGTFHLRTLSTGIGFQELLRAGRTALLRG